MYCCKRITMLLLTIVCLLGCVACSIEGKVAGKYEGTAGSFLLLDEDGTCVYSEDDDTGSGTGTWYVENDTLYIEVSNLRYTIYADIEDTDDGFLLKADSGSWNDEYFTKIE